MIFFFWFFLILSLANLYNYLYTASIVFHILIIYADIFFFIYWIFLNRTNTTVSIFFTILWFGLLILYFWSISNQNSFWFSVLFFNSYGCKLISFEEFIFGV